MSHRRTWPMFLTVLFAGSVAALTSVASGMLNIPDLVAHSDLYDKQAVVVVGKVSDLQTATNRDGQSAFGFLLKAGDTTVKVIGSGRTEVKDGDAVIVEGVFNRLRQGGRALVLNEIKATIVRSLARFNPDLVG